MSENDRKIKRTTRKDFRNALNNTLGDLMFGADFKTLTRQLWMFDDIKNAISHQTRSDISNNILKSSEYWEQISEMRKNKNVDRKKVAKLIKKALKSKGYKEADITKMRDSVLNVHPTFQLFEVVKYETQKLLLGELLKMNIWTKYLQKVRGISILTASKLIFLIKDPTRFSQPSKMIKYCGLAVDKNGVPDRPKKGVELNYNPKLKSLLLGVIADNFIKSNSQYRKVYDERRKHTKQIHPEWGINTKTKKTGYKAHYHADAKRKMIKRFIIEFWKAGYLAEGKEPPTKPYAVRILGHDEEPDIVPYG